MNYGHFLSIANYYLFDKNGDFYNKKSTSSVITNEVLYFFYCCPIKPLYTAISSLNPAEIGMISSYFKFQAPH